MSLNRSLARNVTFYDAHKPNEVLGGFVQNGSVTETNFLDFLEILLVFPDVPNDLHDPDPEGPSLIPVKERTSKHIVSRTDVTLPLGVYDIDCNCL